MAFNTEVLNKYNLPYSVHGCISISSEICVVLGSGQNGNGRFLVLQSGEFDVLNYEIPHLKSGQFNYLGALFKTEAGFGCVFSHAVVEYSFSCGKFKEYPFKQAFPKDSCQRETGPLGTAFKIEENQFLVTLEDYFYKSKGSLFTRVDIHNRHACYDRFVFSMKKSEFSPKLECSAAYINNKILFHRCEYLTMHRDTPSDSSEYCEMRNGKVEVICNTSKGVGRFSTDCSHLIVKTHTKPFKLEFYSLTGEKQTEIALTPKRVIGDIDKKYLSIFDKSGDRLWMARDAQVTETRLIERD